MKTRYSLLITLLGVGIAGAQMPAQVPATKAQVQKAQQVAPAKHASKVVPAERSTEPKPVDAAARPTEAPVRNASRRDPFLSPIVRADNGGAPCAGAGKKCLAVDQVVLRGVVRGPSGMIAVVESTGRKISYFLRENDPVFNGYVVKITADSVVFRENTSDNLGRPGTRDITKRVTAPAV